MTSLLEPVTNVGKTDSLYLLDTYARTHKNCQHRHVLKFRENIFKHKCKKALRRKLKKYKLRQDGGEDQDVIEVSNILVSSLKIKSPNRFNEPLKIVDECDDFEELKPKNYLFKMVRKKNIHKYIEKHNPDRTTAMAPNKSDMDANKHIDDHVSQTPEMIATQEKKQTDAFKLLMDSRNKSIGSNSPGKEIYVDEECDSEKFLEKKSVKSKRKLVLQRMAEAKGSLVRKELEENHEKFIKQKMEKRAEKFKSMILNDKKVLRNNVENVTCKIDSVIIDDDLDMKKNKCNQKNVKKNVKTLQIVDIFNSIEEPVIISVNKKQIPKEDEEFLSKLSPSLKKKESMLSYFKKQEKISDDSNDDNVIKVKLGPKTKKKSKKKKLSLNKNKLDNVSGVNDENLGDNQDRNHENAVSTLLIDKQLKVNNDNQRQKRKRDTSVCTNRMDTKSEPVVSENRPKRSVKKPVKYLEDAHLSSSDEELHIFTPKKKKRAEAVSDCKQTKEKLDKIIENQVPLKPKPEKKIKDKEPKQPVKLAPIFVKQSQVDVEALEAKQKFLQSGVPDKLKKMTNHHKNIGILGVEFPTVVHVQQTKESELIEQKQNLALSEIHDNEEIIFKQEDISFKKLLITIAQEVDSAINYNPDLKIKTHVLLKSLKELYPKFPVYRTYHHLKSRSKGEFKQYNHLDLDNSIEIMNGVVDATSDSPDQLVWTDKFKALSTSQIVGNFESIKELRKWLVSWTENNMRCRIKTTSESDSSDYYQSDTDSRDSVKCMNNLLILTGPTGCGKTSSVYAVAAELAMKVIEVNVSSKRTGKIMLQDLQEATQSHKVNRGTGSATDNTQKTQNKTYSDAPKKLKKRGRPRKHEECVQKKSFQVSDASGTPSSQESVRTDMSLILIDDADIVFEQDDGFSSAIVQLVQSSKRPVILVISSFSCPHLQKFLQNGRILNMNSLLPRMLGIWLDIMCLADNGICWPGLGAKYLNYFMGDIRKAINHLQFYTCAHVTNSNSEQESTSQNIDNFKPNIDDESSSMSWADHEATEGRKCSDDMESNQVWKEFIDKQSNLMFFKQPMELFNVWWSVPSLMGMVTDSDLKREETKNPVDKLASITELEAVANAIDALSMTDYFGHVKRSAEYNITSSPWYSVEADNVTDQQNLDSYIRSHELVDEISHSLVSGSVLAAQNVLCCEKKTSLHTPGMMTHRQRNKVISRHKTLTSFLNPSAVLDRRSLALDYWSSCRTICRIEKNKTDINVKRNNRFCHYLKSVNVLCKTDTFDNLGDSLCSYKTSELSVTNFND